MTRSAASTKLVLVPQPPERGPASPSSGVRRYRLARLALGPSRGDDRFGHLKSVYD
jgi:hypothetical protein